MLSGPRRAVEPNLNCASSAAGLALSVASDVTFVGGAVRAGVRVTKVGFGAASGVWNDVITGRSLLGTSAGRAAVTNAKLNAMGAGAYIVSSGYAEQYLTDAPLGLAAAGASLLDIVPVVGSYRAYNATVENCGN